MKNKIRKSITPLLKKEIEALKGLSHILNSDFDKAVNLLSQTRGKIIVSGVGKSGYIGMKIASTFRSLGIPSIFLHPSEALHGDLGLISKGDVLIAISHSGETRELLKIINHLKRHKVSVIAITGNSKSLLAKTSKVSLVFKIDSEGSPFNLAPMASATASLVLGDLLASALSLKKGFSPQTFADIHPGGSLGLQLTKVSEQMVGGRSVPLVGEAEPFKKVLQEIDRRKLGITGVINKQRKLVGVVTDGDVRRFLLKGGQPDRALASDAMTRKPKIINRDASLQKAIEMMENHKITSLFVVDAAAKPLGVIHMHQIIERQLSS